jgi:hypothetical protein
MMRFWQKKPRFQPSLIDLVEYEKTLLYAREHGHKLVPVMPIPAGKWTDSEMQYMRDNRDKAKEILERISNSVY